MMKKKYIEALYYITHKDNVLSILKEGILSHDQMEKKGKRPKIIYNSDVMKIRKGIILPNGDKLTSYANLYFQPCNPMLYSVLHKGDIKKRVKNIVILQIKRSILLEDKRQKKYVATANAATTLSEFEDDISKGLSKLKKDIFGNNVWWNSLSDGKPRIMAELLVKDKIDVRYISSIYTGDENLKKKLQKNIKDPLINIIYEKEKFFLPNETKSLQRSKITIVKGDMFFSTAQTLTISVNTVGIMGKGLASRTRYQFPDVFVEYQDLCRNKTLKMGKPCLIKREKSIDDVLAAYNSDNLLNKNRYKWFLLFPTKTHWREDSDIEGIEQGLQWLVDNNKQLCITSIAMPALGCGLGKLLWQDVGPLMCKYLNMMDIPSFIYLPMETEMDEEQLTESFLLPW